jgi:hypothetical protein
LLLYRSGDTVAVAAGIVSMAVGISVTGLPVMMGWAEEVLSAVEERPEERPVESPEERPLERPLEGRPLEKRPLEGRPLEAGPVAVTELSEVGVADVLPEFNGTPVVGDTNPVSLLDADAVQTEELSVPNVSETDPAAVVVDSMGRPELSRVALGDCEDDGVIWPMGVTEGLSVAVPRGRVMALWRDRDELCVELADDGDSEATEVPVGAELGEPLGVTLPRPVDTKLSELKGSASIVELLAVERLEVVGEGSSPVPAEVSAKVPAGSLPTDENCRGAFAARVHRRGPASAAAASDKAPNIIVVIRILVVLGCGVLVVRSGKEKKSSRFCGGPAREEKRVK